MTGRRKWIQKWWQAYNGVKDGISVTSHKRKESRGECFIHIPPKDYWPMGTELVHRSDPNSEICTVTGGFWNPRHWVIVAMTATGSVKTGFRSDYEPAPAPPIRVTLEISDGLGVEDLKDALADLKRIKVVEDD